MLTYFLKDANQDVRINAKKAILTMEYGEEPLESRADCVELIN